MFLLRIIIFESTDSYLYYYDIIMTLIYINIYYYHYH